MFQLYEGGVLILGEFQQSKILSLDIQTYSLCFPFKIEESRA